MADLHLRYSQPADSVQPLHLRFGDEGGGIAPPAVDVVLHGRITRGLGGHVGAATVAQASAHGRITRGLRGHAGAAWASNVDRPERVRSASAWQHATPAAAPRAMGWHIARARQAGHGAHWQHARAGASGHGSAWRQSARRASTNAHHWQRALARALLAAARYQQARRHAAQAAARWQHAIGHGRLAGVRWQQTYNRASAAANHWQSARAGAAPGRHRFAQRAALRALLGIAHYQDARRPGDALTIVGPPGQPPCYDPAQPLHLRFVELAAPGLPLHLRFACERAGGGPGPQPGGSIVVARRRSYIVLNSIEVRLAADGTLLPALDSGFSMRLDHRSWTWGFQLSLHAAALPLLTPGPDGLPVELEVTVNGQPFRMLAESRRRSVQFPRAVLEVSGTGRAALLDAPYASQQTFSQPAARTAQQLMLDVLTVNGVSMGWTLDWQLTDWPVPAGTWSHQGSWISAINDIAAAVGAYVQPHDTAQTLRILPRYPVRAWELASATPDITLPAGIATVEEVTWLHKPDYDAIYLQGEPGDKLYHRKRAGTPGTNPAPQAVHPLLVHADAAAQRAIAELSDTGRQIEQRLQLMVLPATGVIKPGTLLRYTDDAAVQRTGIVRATEVRQAGPRIDQTLTVQAHE